MIKQLLNSVIAKFGNLSVSRRSIICLSLRLQQIIDLLATDISQYFTQSRPVIIVYYDLCENGEYFLGFFVDSSGGPEQGYECCFPDVTNRG